MYTIKSGIFNLDHEIDYFISFKIEKIYFHFGESNFKKLVILNYDKAKPTKGVNLNCNLPH